MSYTAFLLQHPLRLLCLYQVEHFQHKLRMKTSTAEFPIAAAPVQMEVCNSMHAQEIQLNNPRATVNSKYAQWSERQWRQIISRSHRQN